MSIRVRGSIACAVVLTAASLAAQAQQQKSQDCSSLAGSQQEACQSQQDAASYNGGSMMQSADTPTNGLSDTSTRPSSGTASSAAGRTLQNDLGGNDQQENAQLRERNTNTREQQLPPDPPSEFQRYVAASTGLKLPVYGAQLFRKLPESFVPSNLSPAPAGYLLGADDELRVRIWGAINYSGNLRVDREGNIFLPQVGSVHVGGLKYAELDTHLRAAVAHLYRNFDLSADLGHVRSIQVYVTGQARRPGVYTISSLSTLVDALFASGGPLPQGSLRHVQLKRNGQMIADFDLYALLLRGDKSGDVPVQSEDVVYIPPAGAQVAVTGSIRNAAIYEMRDHETLADLIEIAGRTLALSARTRVSIDRIAASQHREAMDVAFDAQGMATPIADGDLVRIFATVPSYARTVTLRGSVANPGHFAWKEGMHVSDLIPDRDALLSRDYWWKRAHLGLPAPEFEAAIAPPNQLAQDLQRTNSAKRPEDLAASARAQSGSLAQAVRGDAANVQQNGQNGQDPGPRTEQLIRTLTEEIDWNYAVIERTDATTLKTTLLPFDLGKLVNEHDATQDLAIEPGDTVTIFSQKDIRIPVEQQTKYITLEGEIRHSGTYSVRPGETLRDVVQRAGGCTPSAYLYGSEFLRESTRLLQQQRIDEYVQKLDLEIRRSSIALANYAAMQGNGISVAPTTSTPQDQLLDRLRQVRATGRIVLQMQPAAQCSDAVPAIALENGDHFIVPPVPATVNVVGAVYNENAFLYQKGRTTSGYLKLAGGMTRNADTSKIYVIRADGSVFSHESTHGFWGDQFARISLNPGDTVVAPEKNLRPSMTLKNVLEWSQALSQVAMGAATISLLK